MLPGFKTMGGMPNRGLLKRHSNIKVPLTQVRTSFCLNHGQSKLRGCEARHLLTNLVMHMIVPLLVGQLGRERPFGLSCVTSMLRKVRS
jgi:hypothetical protein